MEFSIIISVFIAGLLTFLAPCTLPLVPGYIAFLGGVSLKDVRELSFSGSARRAVILNSFFFVLGFTAIFMILGLGAGWLGGFFGAHRDWLLRIGGIFVIFFGLFMLEAVHIPVFHHTKRWNVPRAFRWGRVLNSFILGGVFGFGWTPCIGPILGSVLFLASSTATMGQGAFLLGIYSLGLGLPFLAIAVGIKSASRYMRRLAAFGKIFSVLGGIFLMFLGILLLTDNFGVFSTLVYRWFDFGQYDWLLEYM